MHFFPDGAIVLQEQGSAGPLASFLLDLVGQLGQAIFLLQQEAKTGVVRFGFIVTQTRQFSLLAFDFCADLRNHSS